MLGKEHPDTPTSMSSLANVPSDQGKHMQAEEMHELILGLRETVLSNDHPDTITSMDRLTLVLACHGKYERAEEMYREVVPRLYEVMLGKGHPDMLKSISNLAIVLSTLVNEETEEMSPCARADGDGAG